MVASLAPPPLGGRRGGRGGALLTNGRGTPGVPLGFGHHDLDLLLCVSTCTTGGGRQTGPVVLRGRTRGQGTEDG